MADEHSSDEEVSIEKEDLVKEVVQAIMILDHSKKSFRRSDILSFLSHKPPSRVMIEEAFVEAKKRLEDLGYELCERKDSTSKAYFLTSKQYPLSCMYKYASKEDSSTRVLLTLVLAYIFMKNGTVLSDDLVNHLKDLNLYNEDDNDHPYFGNIKKRVFTDFVSQLYLTCTKVPESESSEFSWGPRAEVEISKMSILEFVCQCGYGGKIKPNNLHSFYEKALKESNTSGETTNEIETIE